MAQTLRKGDMVKVCKGKYKGRTGKVLEVLLERDRVRIEGVATVKRHLAPGKDPKVPNGGIVERLGTVHRSNVMVLDSQGRATRVGFRMQEDGTKVRYAKSNGELLGSA
jgi:large subunit ribosomal protein L24